MPLTSSLLERVFEQRKSKTGSVQEVENTVTHAEKLAKEVQNYLGSGHASGETDVLGFWKRESNVYPMLRVAATTILAVQATNCSSERVNSVGGQIITDQRHSLSNNNVETLIWCRKNKDLLF